MTQGELITADAFAMFEKWCELFKPADFEGDMLELVILYSEAPREQHEAAVKAAGLTNPHSR